jgi:hypothetical protein
LLPWIEVYTKLCIDISMQPVDLKIQNAFTVRPPVQTALSVLPKSGGIPLTGQPVYPVQGAEKLIGAMEYSSRIFSPYLTPSAVHAENKQMAQNIMAPTYQQNIAITKYLNISVIPKPKSHLHTNLVA